MSRDRPYITDEVNDFIGQIGQESDRGKVLVSTGYIESRLQEVLLAFMVESKVSISLFSGANSPFGTFSSRIASCFSLGLIDEVEYHDLQLIRRIRNDFAHSVRTSFRTPEVISRCKLLRSTTERVF
jgi:DNA-binding MltR family transcriptional regulator